MLHHIFSLLLREGHPHLIFVLAVNAQLLFHVCDLALDLQRFLSLSYLPGLVFLSLDRLQSQRIVAERILDVPEIRLVCNHLLATCAIEEFGSKLLTLLVIHHLLGLVLTHSFLTAVGNITLGHISEALVNEAT